MQNIPQNLKRGKELYLPNNALKRTWPSGWRYRWRVFRIPHKIVKVSLFKIDRPGRLALCVGRSKVMYQTKKWK
jgi:hypothetical protein